MSETTEKVTLDPHQDGITHINVYSKGKTRLGRLLTNPADVPVTHPRFGLFRTAEGLYFYLITGKSDEGLRAMDGFTARKHGKSLPKVWNNDFQTEFKEGLARKILDHPELYGLFVRSTLPFEHYYCYHSKNPDTAPKVQVPSGHEWMIQFFTELRAQLRKEGHWES